MHRRREAEAGGDSVMYRMDLDLDRSDGKRRIQAYVCLIGSETPPPPAL